MKKLMAALIVVTLISGSVPALASDGSGGGASVAASMIVDVIIARPAGFVGTILGSAIFVLALPFAALGRNVEPVVQTLVVDPFKFTFTRPVGDFSCWEH
jgi:hypothetical protein